jgi:hypothetical protein
MPRVVPLPPSLPRTVVPPEPRSVAPDGPPSLPPVERVGRRAWWVPWVAAGSLVGAVVFVVALVWVSSLLAAHRAAQMFAADAPRAAPVAPHPAPPAAAPAPAPVQADVTVQSEPSGAQVFEGGALVGITPATIPLRGGPGSTSVFELRLDGYQPEVVSVPWTDDDGAVISVPFKRPRRPSPAPASAPAPVPDPAPGGPDLHRAR